MLPSKKKNFTGLCPCEADIYVAILSKKIERRYRNSFHKVNSFLKSMDMQTTFSQIYGVISQDIIMYCINLSRRMIYILIRNHWGQVQGWPSLLKKSTNSCIYGTSSFLLTLTLFYIY